MGATAWGHELKSLMGLVDKLESELAYARTTCPVGSRLAGAREALRQALADVLEERDEARRWAEVERSMTDTGDSADPFPWQSVVSLPNSGEGKD